MSREPAAPREATQEQVNTPHVSSLPEERGAGTARRAPHLGVFGHFGDRNLGDEAIIESLITRLHQQWHLAEIVAFSIDPADTARRYGLRAYPIRQTSGRQGFEQMEQAARQRTAPAAPRVVARPRGAPSLLDRVAELVPKGALRTAAGRLLRGAVFCSAEVTFIARSLWRIRRLDAMFIAGSNQFLDNFGGPWGFPYTVLKWTILCRLVGCRVFFVSVGAGPLEDALSHRMARQALRLGSYASFRDHGSLELIRARVLPDAGVLSPDLAHGLQFEPNNPDVAERSDRALRIAINPMPIYDPRFWPSADSARYAHYVGQMAGAVVQLLRAGHEVSFFTTHFPDGDVALDIHAAIAGIDPAVPAPRIERPMSVQALMTILSAADLVVATRFHGILLALHAQRPVVGLSYFRKSEDLMRRFEQQHYALPVDALRTDKLVDLLQQLAARRGQEAAVIAAVDRWLQADLEAQYRVLFAQLAR